MTVRETETIVLDPAEECLSCKESLGEPNECPHPVRPCGHHCNHIWTHDTCCCGYEEPVT